VKKVHFRVTLVAYIHEYPTHMIVDRNSSSLTVGIKIALVCDSRGAFGWSHVRCETFIYPRSHVKSYFQLEG